MMMERLPALLTVLATPLIGAAQLNPVYVDDSPTARDTLARAVEFAGSGNLAEAARSLQRLLDEEPDRLVSVPGNPDLFVSVREAVHDRLLHTPQLLEQYRRVEGPTAQWMLEQKRTEEVERTRLLTRAGLDAAIQEADTLLLRGHIEGARLRLVQLENHPDRVAGEGGDAAARALARVVRYLPRESLVERARRWAREAGLGGAEIAKIGRDSPDLPPLVRRRVVDPIAGLEGPAPRRVSESPLAWGQLAPPAPGSMDPEWRSTAETLVEDLAEGLWVLPAAAEDTLYINDGIWISAWDRYTLDLRWVADLEPPPVPGEMQELISDRDRPRVFARRLEDANTVTLHGRIALAVTGLATDGGREGDGRVHALDSETGEGLWSVELGEIDPSLADASVRGPIAAVADTLVLAVRRVDRGQRLQTVTLVGLSVADGSLRWIRPMGSAGALPYARGGSASDGITIHRGLALRVDDLGVMAAVDAATGRPVWLRTFPSIDLARSKPQSAWETHVPIALGERVLVRSPDRREILALESETGYVVGRRSTDGIGAVEYLVRVGKWLAIEGEDRAGFLPLEGFETSEVAWSRPSPGGVHGRMVAAADALLVPHRSGVSVIEPATPGRPVAELELARPGTVLPFADELVVLDDFRVAAHLSWSVAERVLRDRMEREPDNPTPAVMLAEVAFRAGRPERVAAAADTALAAISRMDDRSRASNARRRLFEALEAMVMRMQTVWDDAAGESSVTSLREAREIIERLGRVAASNGERVVHLLALGRLREVGGEPALAIDAYQSLLAERPLAEAILTERVPQAPAASIASRRIRALVRKYGPSIYAAYDAAAARAAEDLGLLVAPSDLEALARRYPSATVAPGLWARAAELHEAEGEREAALLGWSRAIDAAAALIESGGQVGGRGVAELVGALLDALERQGRTSAAAHSLAELRERLPGLEVAIDGRREPAQAVLSRLRSALRGGNATRLPRVGLALGQDPIVLGGWSILRPRDESSTPGATEHLLLLSRGERRVALFGVAFGGSSAPRGEFRELWSIPVRERLPALVRSEPDAFLLYWPDEEGGTLERIDAIEGTREWISEPFTAYFDPDPAFDQYTRGAAEVAGEGRVLLASQLFAASDAVVALVQRSGRVVAFDETTGRLLWKARTPVRIVSDIDARDGRLLVVGRTAEGEGPVSSSSVVLDLATGETLSRTGEFASRAIWGLLVDRGFAVVGMEGFVAGLDLTRGRVAWRLDETETGGGILHAWVFEDLLLLLDSNRDLRSASARTGELLASPATAKLRMSTRIRAHRKGDRIVLAGSGGIVLIGLDGEAIAEDALGAGGRMLLPVPVRDGFLVLVTVPQEIDSARPAYFAHKLGDRSARLIDSAMISGVWETPERLAAMEGWIALEAGSHTIVYRAPTEGEPRENAGPASERRSTPAR